MRRGWGQRVLLSLTVAVLGLGVALTALATNGGWLVFFTDNMEAAGVDPAPTMMEQALLKRINSATRSIDAAFYDFNRNSIRDALIAAYQRGVTVQVVADDEARFENDAYAPYFQALEEAGITLIDDSRSSSIMHNKYFVIDGEVVWTGSTNLSDNGFTKNHNNTVVFTSTQLADIYLYDFNQMLAGAFSTSKTASLTTTFDYNGAPVEVYFSPQDNALEEVIAEVNAAQESVAFAIFFFTDDGLRDALIERAAAGVSVRGIWDLLGAANRFSDDEALCGAGVPIKIEDTIGKMHNKFMVIDADSGGPRVVTGSMNWTSSGGARNDENTLIIHDGEVARQYARAFDAMWAALDPSTVVVTY